MTNGSTAWQSGLHCSNSSCAADATHVRNHLQLAWHQQHNRCCQYMYMNTMAFKKGIMLTAACLLRESARVLLTCEGQQIDVTLLSRNFFRNITSLKETYGEGMGCDGNTFVMHGHLHALNVARGIQPRFASPKHKSSGFQELWQPESFYPSILIHYALTEPDGLQALGWQRRDR